MFSQADSNGFWHFETVFVDVAPGRYDYVVRAVGENIEYDENGNPISGTIERLEVTFFYDLSGTQTPLGGFTPFWGGPNFFRNQVSYVNLNMTVEELNALDPDWFIYGPDQAVRDAHPGLLIRDRFDDDGSGRAENRVSGGDGDDTIVAWSFATGAYGGEGDDVIIIHGGRSGGFGGAGNDRIEVVNYAEFVGLHGGDGNDTLLGSAAPDSLYGGDGDDILYGRGSSTGPEEDFFGDFLYGGAGDDTIVGGDGYDEMYGDDGNDRLSGGGGRDSMSGGAGEDTLSGGTGDDTMDGGADDDVLSGGDGNDLMEGGDGNDVLRGGSGDDTLTGGAGDDTLQGGDGDDVLVGSPGTDRMNGGDGADTFVFTTGAGRGIIGGFTPGEDLLAIDFGLAVTAQEAYDLFLAGAVEQNGSVVFTGPGGFAIVILYTDLDDLSADDFLATAPEDAIFLA